jgi:hypothetical protein
MAQQQVVYVNAPPVQQVEAPPASFKDKPLDCCMYTVLAMAVIVMIGGIIVIAIGAGVTTHFGSVILCGFLILIGSSLGVPAVFCKNKWGMVGFVVILVLLCIIGGIVAGVNTVIGGIVDAICDSYQHKESQYYVCTVAADKCNAHPAYGASDTKAPDCTKRTGGDLTCCQGVAAHWAKNKKNQGCIKEDTKTLCDESSGAASGGYLAVVFSIIGCLTGCIGCCTCCMNGSFFDNHHAQDMNVTVAAVATPQTEVVAANTVAAPEMEKTEVVGATVTTEVPTEVPQAVEAPAPPYTPAAQRNCC